MESGGKAVTKRYRKKITVVLSLVLPVIVLFAISNCFTTYVFYEDYKYKMNLMTEIAAKEEFSGLDAVSELLKDKDIETNEQGRRLLEQYGYWGNKGNAFYSQFRHQVMVIGAVSTVICVLLLTFLLYWKKKEDACHQKILDQLEEILIRFRENKFDDLLKTEDHAELEKLNDQLEAIGHHIQLIKEEARAEKENTKEMVSDISHQLKTPVAALDTCFSVLMQNDLSATEQEEFRIRCRSALDGLETLLQSLLEISKMETGLIQRVCHAHDQISQTEQGKHTVNAAQVCQAGVNIREQFKAAKLRFPAEVHPVDTAADILCTQLLYKGAVITAGVHLQADDILARFAAHKGIKGKPGIV